jgi:hypothetical protein
MAALRVRHMTASLPKPPCGVRLFATANPSVGGSILYFDGVNQYEGILFQRQSQLQKKLRRQRHPIERATVATVKSRRTRLLR